LHAEHKTDKIKDLPASDKQTQARAHTHTGAPVIKRYTERQNKT